MPSESERSVRPSGRCQDAVRYCSPQLICTVHQQDVLRLHIHFADNNKRVLKGQSGHDPLFKVAWALDTMMNGCRAAWKTG